MENQKPFEIVNMKQALLSLQHELIKAALEATGGNKTKAAKMLEVKRTTLVEMIRRMNKNEV